MRLLLLRADINQFLAQVARFGDELIPHRTGRFLPCGELAFRNDIDFHALGFQILQCLQIFCLGVGADGILDFLAGFAQGLLLVVRELVVGISLMATMNSGDA